MLLGLSFTAAPLAASDIRCLVGFKALADSEIADSRLERRRQTVSVPSAEESRQQLLTQSNPNQVWDSTQSPLGVYYAPGEKGSRDTGGYVHADDIAVFNKDLQKRLKPTLKETTQEGKLGELLTHVFQAEARAAHELDQQIRKLSRAGSDPAAISTLEARLSSLLEDIVSKGLETTGVQSLSSLPLKYRRQMGVVVRDALQRFLELHQTPHEVIAFERATPGAAAKSVIRILPHSATPLGRLAKSLDRSSTLLVVNPLAWFEPDGRTVHIGKVADERPYYALSSVHVDSAMDELARERSVRAAGQMVKTSQSRSPLEVRLYRVEDRPRGRSLVHESATGSQAANAHRQLREVAEVWPDYEAFLKENQTPQAFLTILHSLIAPARDYDEAVNRSTRMMDGILSVLTVPGFVKMALISTKEFPALVFTDADSGEYLAELRAIEHDGAVKLSLRTKDQIVIFPAKGPELEQVGTEFLEQIAREKQKNTEVNPSPLLQDLAHHTLVGLNRNIHNSYFMLKPGTQAVAEAWDRVVEFGRSPNPQSYSAVIEALNKIPEVDATRSTNRGIGEEAKPLRGQEPQPLLRGKASPYLSKKLAEAEGADRRSWVGQIGVDAITRWAYARDYAVSDRSLDNVGYDIMLINRKTGKRFYVEVKARSAGKDDSIVTLSTNEVAFAQANPETALLGYVRVHPDGSTEMMIGDLNLGASNPAISSVSLDVNRLPTRLKDL